MSGTVTSRIGRVLGYDGPVAALVLTVFQYFLLSASFIACLAPVLVFQALVGWQSTHLALWLGAASLLTLAPAVQALCVAAAVLLDDGAGARVGRVFWSAFAGAVRTRWGASLAVSGIVLVLGYDIALLGSDAGMLMSALAIAAVAGAILLAAAFAGAEGDDRRGLALVTAAARLAVMRPHLALVWLLLAALGAFATSLPVVGAIAWFSAPALSAVAAVICNRTLGFASALERVTA